MVSITLNGTLDHEVLASRAMTQAVRYNPEGTVGY